MEDQPEAQPQTVQEKMVQAHESSLLAECTELCIGRSMENVMLQFKV
jgi:hypothetical protein